MITPRAAPVGAPAENVENAIDRIRDGGNACARIPICAKDEHLHFDLVAWNELLKE
jgi:hypothetical protein